MLDTALQIHRYQQAGLWRPEEFVFEKQPGYDASLDNKGVGASGKPLAAEDTGSDSGAEASIAGSTLKPGGGMVPGVSIFALMVVAAAATGTVVWWWVRSQRLAALRAAREQARAVLAAEL